MEEAAIKITWYKDIYLDKDNGIWKLKDTNLPLNGKYQDEYEIIRYFKNGKKHNENGPAYIAKKGKYHNENGPAYIEKDGYKEYYIKDRRHRIDGPAVIYSNGQVDWYINGHHIEKETMNTWLMENNIPLAWTTWTDSDKMLFALFWSSYNS